MAQVIGGPPRRHPSRVKGSAKPGAAKPVAPEPASPGSLFDVFKRTPPRPKPTYSFMNGPGKTGPLTWEMRDHSLERALAKAKLPAGTPGADVVWVPADRRPHP